MVALENVMSQTLQGENEITNIYIGVIQDPLRPRYSCIFRQCIGVMTVSYNAKESHIL